MDYIRINSDLWEDLGKIWFVEEYKTREDSTAIELVLRDSLGNIDKRTVPISQIEWVEEGF